MVFRHRSGCAQQERVWGDRGRGVRIERETLLKAIKGKEDDNSKGEILVRTRPCGSEVAIDLIDSGSGMSDETLQKIFEPFFSTKIGGTGLGLPTVRKVI